MLFHFFNFPNVISGTRVCVTNQNLNASFHQYARSISLHEGRWRWLERNIPALFLIDIHNDIHIDIHIPPQWGPHTCHELKPSPNFICPIQRMYLHPGPPYLRPSETPPTEWCRPAPLASDHTTYRTTSAPGICEFGSIPGTKSTIGPTKHSAVIPDNLS